MTQNFISVMHGNMTVNVPRDIFIGPDAAFDEEKTKRFKEVMKCRYPWLNSNAMDVLLRNARKEMLRILDEETGGRNVSKRYESQGKNELAIRHLEEYLGEHPDDADSWYALGELLCKCGRTEEGYKALNKGRSLI